MAHAVISSFPFPASPLASTAAQSFVKSSWAYIGGITSFVSFVADPYPETANPGTVFKVDYPAGSMGGPQPPAKPGGIPGMMLAPFGGTTAPKQQRAIISYKVAFTPNFNFKNGGKLPGAYGGSGGCSGGTHNEHCFSARLMWRTHGAGEVYLYVPTYAGEKLSKRDYGVSLATGSWTFSTTTWTEVTQVIILNSPAAATGPANGYLAQYVNGNLVMERTDMVFRTDPAVGISRLFFSTFFGGSNSISFWASTGGSAFFKDFQFFSSTAASTSAGQIVTPTFPADQAP